MSEKKTKTVEPKQPARRCIVNVATGHFVIGQQRLLASPHLCADTRVWTNELPPGSPTHEAKPYAFKSHALMAVADEYPLLLWCDACIKPARSLEPLWERIERDGYWIAANDGWDNWQWTAQAAYEPLKLTEKENRHIPHVIGGAFGVDTRTKIGRNILDELFRLAQTDAFCGPWTNNRGEAHWDTKVLGHRHDQTALSVIAHRLGCKITHAPDPFCYAGGETEATILIADGAY